MEMVGRGDDGSTISYRRHAVLGMELGAGV